MTRSVVLVVLAGLLAAASGCTVSPGDGSKCSADPCSWCSGKAAGVYADPGALGKTYFDCFTPTGAECLACRGGETDAQCPSAPASPAPVSPASPSPTTPSSPAPAGTCTQSPGDGSTCSAPPCTLCAGKAAGVYPDPGAVGKTYIDCWATGAECLKCYGEADYQCSAPVSPGASPAAPASPVPTAPGTPSSPAPAGTCSLSPGDGSVCSQNPCTWCVGKAAGVYADPGATGKTYFDCWPTGAECLACSGYENDAQCPSTPGSSPAAPSSPVTPSSPAPVGSCTIQPGDGSVCTQNPCQFCAGKADGTYPDTPSNSTTFYDCFSATAPGGAECLKCYASGWSACPGATLSPALPGTPANPAAVAATVNSAVSAAQSAVAAALAGRKRLA